MNFYNSIAEYIAGQKKDVRRLVNFPTQGVIKQCYLSTKTKKEGRGYSVTTPSDSITVDARGIHSDRHRCTARKANGREKSLYGKKDGVRPLITQKRHLFAVSSGDVDKCSEQVGVSITPELLGANLLITGEKEFLLSYLPRGTYIVIGEQGAQTRPTIPKAVFVVEGQQYGCAITGAAIERTYGKKGLSLQFMQKTRENRGVVLECVFPVAPEDVPLGAEGVIVPPAQIKPGDSVFFCFPTGRID